MNVRDFDFALPSDLIAQEPPPERGGSRLLFLNRATGAVIDTTVAALPTLLRRGDVLVINNTRVFPARLIGRRVPSGGAVECLLVSRLEADRWEDTGQVDVVFDVIGGDILDRSAALVRPGGTLVSIAHQPTVRPDDGQAVFFVVEPDRVRLADLARRLRDGRLRVRVGAVRSLADAPAAFTSRQRVPGRTISRVAED